VDCGGGRGPEPIPGFCRAGLLKGPPIESRGGTERLPKKHAPRCPRCQVSWFPRNGAGRKRRHKKREHGDLLLLEWERREG